MGGIARTLDGLTAVTAALESSDVQILDLEVITSDGETGEVGNTALLTLRLADSIVNENDEEVFQVRINSYPIDSTAEFDETGKTGDHSPPDQSVKSAGNGHGQQAPENESNDSPEREPDEEPTPASEVDETLSEEQTESDGPIPCRHVECDETFDTERGMKIHFTKTHLEGATTSQEDDDDRPAYADPAQLRRVYKKFDTFEKMTEALEVDVTPATVRRHMIKYGIYDPETAEDLQNTQNTGDEISRSQADQSDPVHKSSEDDGSVGRGNPDTDEKQTENADPVARIREKIAAGSDSNSPLPDAEELPDGVTFPDLVEAMVSSRTVHEVATSLEIEYDIAREILDTFDLLGLVQGRLKAQHSREERERKVAERIEEIASQKQSPSPAPGA